jgi:Fe2+ transport system protein FeoA
MVNKKILLSLSRMKTRSVTGLLAGHTLRRRLHVMGLVADPISRVLSTGRGIFPTCFMLL